MTKTTRRGFLAGLLASTALPAPVGPLFARGGTVLGGTALVGEIPVGKLSASTTYIVELLREGDDVVVNYRAQRPWEALGVSPADYAEMRDIWSSYHAGFRLPLPVSIDPEMETA